MKFLKPILAVALVTFASATALAQVEFSVPDITVDEGEDFTLPVTMTNEVDIVNFQFFFTLPEGFEVATDSRDRLQITLTDRKDDHTLSSNLDGDVYKVAALSLSDYPFYDNDGVLVNIEIVNNAVPGTYVVEFNTIITQDTEGNRIDAPDCSCTITVKGVVKENQSITWNQDFSDLHVGDVVTLDASASSGLTVDYTILSGAECASLNGNELTLTAVGTVVVAADQAGNEEYNAAEQVTKTIEILTSGIDDVKVANNIKVVNHSVYLSDEAKIYSVDGKLVYSGFEKVINLPHKGLYIVVCGELKEKIVIQ